MGIVFKLSTLALRPLLNGVCEALGAKALVASGDAVVSFLTERFTDHSQRLASALQSANEKSWQALEIALLGDSLWDRCKAATARGEDKAFGRQIRSYLDAAPLPEFTGKSQFRKHCLTELRAARKAGILTGAALDTQELARHAGPFAQFADPQRLLDAEWQALASMADEMKEARYPGLAWLVSQRPAQGLPLLVLAVRYFFRRAVEEDTKLFQGMAFARMEALSATQDAGFAALAAALAESGQRLEELLGDVRVVVVETHGAVLDLQEQMRGQTDQIQNLGQAVLKLLGQYQLQRRELLPGDSLSIRTDGERLLVKELVNRYRALPTEVQSRLPALLNGLGKLEVVAGDFESAQQDFQKVATLVPDPGAKAEAHHSAYRAALERRDSAAAIEQLRAAVKIDGKRFAPFPVGKYHPLRILGAGGFGVAFLCRHKQLQKDVVVKAITGASAERDFDQLFDEARALHDLEHPAIIRLLDCGYTFPATKSRPYFVMHHFDGLTLEHYVDKHGPLRIDDAVAVARQIADGLQAAHAKGILHRDIKPANVLVAHDATAAPQGATSGWQVKLIDFGLALRQSATHSTAPLTSVRTLVGSSIAGTLDYAAPEQMGRLPGTAVGPYSDVYGFARTCCYALFKTPHPRRQHWNSLPGPLAELLDVCLSEPPKERPASFAIVLERLRFPAATAPAPSPAPSPQVVMPRLADAAPIVVSAQAKSSVDGLTSPDGSVRLQSAEKLQQLADLSAVPALMQRVADDVWLVAGSHDYQKDPYAGGKNHALIALRALAPAKVAEALMAALTSKTEQVRAWACSMASPHEDKTATAGITALSDRAETVRIAAATVLGQWEDQPSAAALITALSDRSAAVKCAAAAALGKRKEASACDGLALLLADRRDDHVRIAAVAALAQMDQPPVLALTQALNDLRPEVRLKATEVLQRLGDEAAVPALMKRVADDVWHVAGSSAHQNDPYAGGKLAALGALRALAPDKVPEALLAALKSKTEPVRTWACTSLADEDDKTTSAALISALSDRAPAVKIAAAAALGKRKEASACEALVLLLVDRRDDNVRIAAVGALAQMDEPPVSALAQALNDARPEVRLTAAGVLQRLGDDAAVPALMKRVADDVWHVAGTSAHQNDPYAGGKLAALGALRALAPDKGPEALLAALKSKTEQVRAWACTALADEDDKTTRAGLITALSDRSAAVKIAAAGALGKRKEGSACEGLALLLADRRDDNVRIAAVGALAQMDQPPVPALAQALNDPRPEIRLTATGVLQRLGDDAAVAPLKKRVADDVWLSGLQYAHQNDPHGGGKNAALVALRALAPEHVAEALLAALKSKTEQVRAWACTALAGEDDKTTKAGLIAALSDRAASVKVAAAGALGQRKEVSAREAINKLLKDADANVRSAAEKVLANL